MKVYRCDSRFFCTPLKRYIPVGAHIARYENATRLVIDDAPVSDQDPFNTLVDGIEYDEAATVSWFYGMESNTSVFTHLSTKDEDAYGNVSGTGSPATGFSSLSDENISATPIDGQIVKYDSASGKWINSSSLAVTLQVRSETKAVMDAIVLAEGELAYVTDTKEVRVGDGTTAGGVAVDKYTSGSRTLAVDASGTPVENAASLKAVYAVAKTMTPLITDRVSVFLPPAKYDIGTGDGSNHGLELDTEFIDLVGMTGYPEDVVLTSAITNASRGTVEVTADDVKIRGLTMGITSASSTGSGATEASAYFPDTALTNAVLTDVICQSETTGVNSMRTYIEYAGTYTRVTSGGSSFGGSGTASGTFTDCVGGTYSFGAYGTANGTFTDCVGSSGSFGGGGTASGTFTDCVSAGDSFGTDGTANGTFTDCVGGTYSFGAYGTASGTFTDCVGALYSFGGFGTVDAGAVFIRCLGAGVGTHMNTGTTRDCYTSAWVTIDNEAP